MPQNAKLSGWFPVLVKLSITVFFLGLLDFLIVFLIGPQLWSNVGYLFGSDTKSAFCFLMFIESGVLLAFGSLWASGPMDNVRYGRTEKTHGAISREDWEQRKKLAEKPNQVISVSLLTGGILLAASVLLFVI